MPKTLRPSPANQVHAVVNRVAHRSGIAGLAIVATLLLVVAARPSLLPTGVALLAAVAMVGVALAIMVLGEARRRALTALEDARHRNEAIAEAEQAARGEAGTVARRLAFLVDAGEVLSASLDHQTTLTSLARLTVPYLADWCVIDMVEDDGTFSRLAVVHSDPAKEETARRLRGYTPEPGDAHGLGRVMRTASSEFRPVVEAAAIDARDDEHRRLVLDLGLVSYMCVPLVARGRTLGALGFVYGTADRRYTRDDLALAEAVARRAAIAIDNARLFRDAEAASRAKDEFLATLSHELRTPLHAILGWTRMLSSGTLDEPTAARALETVERNTRLQSQLIDDLLDVSRVITGKFRIDVRPVSLAGVVAAALDAVRPAADAKGVRLEARADPASGLVAGDGDRLQQVAWNLLSNAIKFTPRGGLVQIRLEPRDGHVRIQVADTGRGIDAAFLPHVFERFRQAESLAARTAGGLGLGLAIVRHIVELHGGTVRADSAGEGRGATFTVDLPELAREHDAVPPGGHPPDSRDGPEARAALSGLRVLVVEDDQDARDLLVAVLEGSGAAVTAVVTAAQALDAMARVRPDALVSDLALPGEDGYALIRRVRALPPASGGLVPAVALTARAADEDRQRALRAGFQRHVVKPIEPAAFVDEVTALVRPRQIPPRAARL
jgi:signal transduction histidine kinase/ActR/RegA family two-component response regulator